MPSIPFLLLFVVMATAMPDDPADLVLDAFEHHRVVAVGENHGHKEFHSWLLHLLERPDAQTAIDDIAIEWGNARYQDIIDRYVRGQDVPRDSVTMAWRNTIVSPNTVWDAQVYGRFFEGIRRINTTLEPGNQYRVLLADSPVDWDEVDSREDLSPYFDRAQYMAEVVRRESLLKGRHTLFIAGGLHVSRIPRRRIREDGVPIGEITPVAWLELMHPGSVFVIQSMGRAHELGIPLLTTMGKPVARALTSSPALASIQANSTTTLKNRDGSKTDVYGAAVLSDIIDAVLLWDPSDVTLQDPDPDVFQIDWYWDELNRRSRIMRGAPMNAALRSDN